jgi:hypothetical protein
MTKQQEKVYRYILNNRGCTTHDIMRDTFIQCPSGRISELRNQGVKIQSVGHKKYEGSKAIEMYTIEQPLTKTIEQVEVVGNVAVVKKITVQV